jgi:hypothetical protein
MNDSKKGRSAWLQRGGEIHLLHSFNPFQPEFDETARNLRAISWTGTLLLNDTKPTLADFFNIPLGITIAPPPRHAWTRQT